jgi:hypothetical protein
MILDLLDDITDGLISNTPKKMTKELQPTSLQEENQEDLTSTNVYEVFKTTGHLGKEN